jgi:hypothetical protein
MRLYPEPSAVASSGPCAGLEARRCRRAGRGILFAYLTGGGRGEGAPQLAIVLAEAHQVSPLRRGESGLPVKKAYRDLAKHLVAASGKSRTRWFRSEA